MTDSPRSANEAAAFLKEAHQGPAEWRALCLKLQRMARGLPAVYPSALSAAEATPLNERVHQVRDLERGMVAYSDDPNDSNKWGHIYFIAGWAGSRDTMDNCLTWTNDAYRSGGVDLVPITFYRSNWGDAFQFGATWLNGYELSVIDKDKPKPAEDRPTLGANYQAARADVAKALRWHRSQGHTKLVKLLERDLAVMDRRLANWRKQAG